MKRLIIGLVLASCALYSYAQGYIYRKNSVETEWIQLGSLPKTAVNPHQKLKIKLFGGHETNSSLGESTYTIATRGGIQVNMYRQGGRHDEDIYKFKIFESENSIDFVLEVPYQWVVFHIESVLINGQVNQITAAQQVEIKRYNTSGKTDITAAHPIRVISATAQNGYTGMGTNTPTARLDVAGDIKGTKLDINGTIRSKEVKIEATGWSDFVFDEDYRLPALSEVESHIKAHKHLPDVPGEKQVIEEGVNVVEMQAKLLQKIEELTLYVIEQDKEIKALKEENKIIKKQLR